MLRGVARGVECLWSVLRSESRSDTRTDSAELDISRSGSRSNMRSDSRSSVLSVSLVWCMYSSFFSMVRCSVKLYERLRGVE